MKNPFEEIRSFEDFLDGADLLLTQGYYHDFRIGYQATDRLSYRPLVSAIREVFDPLRERGSYQFFVMSRYLRWVRGGYEPVRRTLIMDYRTETIGAPPERQENHGTVIPNSSEPACRMCGGIGGFETATVRSGVPENVWALHNDLDLSLNNVLTAETNHPGSLTAVKALIPAAQDLKVALEQGMIQVMFGGTVFGFGSTLSTRVCLVEHLRSFQIPIGDVPMLPTKVEWTTPCYLCRGEGTRKEA